MWKIAIIPSCFEQYSLTTWDKAARILHAHFLLMPKVSWKPWRKRFSLSSHIRFTLHFRVCYHFALSFSNVGYDWLWMILCCRTYMYIQQLPSVHITCTQHNSDLAKSIENYFDELNGTSFSTSPSNLFLPFGFAIYLYLFKCLIHNVICIFCFASNFWNNCIQYFTWE